MYELLQKLGVPAGIAGIIGALVVVIPFIFKVDERYAKAEDYEKEISALEQHNQDLRVELAQQAAFMQAMSQFVLEGRVPKPAVTASEPIRKLRSAPAPAPIVVPPSATFDPALVEAPAAGPAPAKIEEPKNWRELNEGVKRQQERLAVPMKDVP